ncbi:MAG: phage tail tape measure protein [Planctomycetes bacterium]|nr:phage tail tape measure protein [Planctomycetota bacterium]
MAANTGAIKAGKAFVELFADDKKLVAALRRASARLKAFGAAVRQIGTKMAGLGAAVVAPMAMAAKNFADVGSRLWDMSKRTGVSVEALSILGYAAQQSGSSMEDLEKSLRKMQKTIVDAASGSSSANEAFAMLGLTVKDLAGLSPEEQFKLIADRIDRIADPTLRTAAAMEIFGKSGTGLLPMLEGGAASLDAFAKQARRLGLVISTEDARAADEFGDVLSDLWKVLKQGVFVVGSALAPSLKDLATWITGVVVRASEWLKQNKELVLTIFKVAAAVVAGGIALIALGYAISGLGAIFGVLATILTGVGSVLGMLGAILAWMLSPIGMVITAMAALGGYIIYASGMGGKALDWLSEKFGELKDDAISAYQGIADALAAGDIGLAAKILWLTLKMEWQKGVNWISSIWNEGLQWVEKRAIEAFYGLGMAVGTIWHGMEVGWIELTAGMSEIWTMLCTAVQAGWNWTAKSLQQTWNWLKGIFDENFDASAANAVIERNYQEANKKLEAEMLTEINRREEQRTAQRAASKQAYDAQMKAAITEAEKAKSALDKDFAARKEQNQKELDQAKKEWKDAIKEAGTKRKAKEASAGPMKMEGPEDVIEKARRQLGGLGDLMEMTSKKTIGVKGTFNAMEARGMGAGGVTDRIANASEETAKNTRKLLDKAKDGLTFE